MSKNSIIKNIENSQIKDINIINKIKSGCTVKIENINIINKNIQIFFGIVISISRKGISTSITVRKMFSNSEGVEKTFFIYSPTIKNISIIKYNKVRKSKLFFIRKNNKYIKI
ncbi:50S ribosomal protein L19 [endosymbiont of Sipalinus gigas]|uniref:50S ribosomal protein L19 n=1 Tax=endosymbiont of Sipalinus gigas TaxID=1972134 RepID=UPI000DC72655|nr:50S ribosomal protein L19 [endosymbiont of Sipalinus gigas]BBA85215.1 50S ribosomal protein L19 [endosymbiont of Sipalinus gigas]